MMTARGRPSLVTKSTKVKNTKVTRFANFNKGLQLPAPAKRSVARKAEAEGPERDRANKPISLGSLFIL